VRIFSNYKKHLKLHYRRWKAGRQDINLEQGVSYRELGSAGYHTFFGYYEVTPYDHQDERLLAVRCKAGKNWAKAGTPLELGYFDLTSKAGAFNPLGSSRAWCWQMGCRLQWLNRLSENMVFFNETQSGKHVSVMKDVVTGEVYNILPRAGYSVSEERKVSISLNFSRLQRLRPGYGYDDIKDMTLNVAAPEDDGLWAIDLESGDEQLLLSLKEVALVNPHPTMEGATHYFNHVLWNPDSSRFFFIHLWVDISGKRYGRGLVWDMETESTIDLGLVKHTSHYWWINPNELVVFSTHEDTGMHYHFYDVISGTHSVLGAGVLTEDGHPSFRPGSERWMLTDTYPNKLRDQTLMVFDKKANSIRTIASIFSPPKFTGEFRCDLHPRWNHAGTEVCIDAPHKGERRLGLFKLSNFIEFGEG